MQFREAALFASKGKINIHLEKFPENVDYSLCWGYHASARTHIIYGPTYFPILTNTNSHVLSNAGCCGCWCLPCLVGDNAERLDDSFWLYCFLTYLCPAPIPVFILRQKTRERYGINGSSWKDAGAACCCTCCASVQIANELNDQGEVCGSLGTI